MSNTTLDGQMKVEVTPLDPAQQISDKILQLQEELRTNSPGYERSLFVIHATLSSHPDTVHFLKDGEIGIICRGLAKKTGVVVSEVVTKSKAKTSSGKKLSDITVGEL